MWDPGFRLCMRRPPPLALRRVGALSRRRRISRIRKAPANARRSMALSFALVALVLNADDAYAQRPWTGRVRGAFNALVQTDSAGLSQSLTLVKNNEPASITADLSPTIVPLFEGGIVVRIAGNLGAGAAFSSLTRTDEAQIAARIPHPFFFNQPRAIEGTSSVEQKEFATHLSAVYVVPFDRLD